MMTGEKITKLCLLYYEMYPIRYEGGVQNYENKFFY